MAQRRDYEMTEQDLETLLAACRAVPLLVMQCGPIRSPQENANAAWKELGQRMGFAGTTARPTGRGDRFFSAIPVEPSNAPN